MKIAVTGATGNVGTSILEALKDEPEVEDVLGIARRAPHVDMPKTRWVTADVTKDDLVPLFDGMDAVVHLAWAIQPSRDAGVLRRINVEGSRRVFSAVAQARVPALVYASSVGAYSPGSKSYPVDESWPTRGIDTSFYARHKAEVEEMLDHFEQEHPGIRIVRLRPGLIFKREAAAEIRRLFLGPFLPNVLVQRRFIPFVPLTEGLTFQCVHSLDVGHAYRLALTSDVHGAFNVAADPVIDRDRLLELLDARGVMLPPQVFRAAAAAMWRLRMMPTPEGWVDMGLSVPVMSIERARKELGWTPQSSAQDALLELIDGLRHASGGPTPPLAPPAGIVDRVKEVAQGIGSRTGL